MENNKSSICSIKIQLADILTKVVSTKMFEEVLFKLGVQDFTTHLEKEC